MRSKPASSRTAKAIQRNAVYKYIHMYIEKKNLKTTITTKQKRKETHKKSVLVEVWTGGSNLNYPTSLNIAWALLAFTRKL